MAAPAHAAERPPRPLVKSHGVRVKAGYVGQCPRREQKPPCGIPDFFATTKPVPVHDDGLLRINTRRVVRRLRLDLDCSHRRSDVIRRRRWTFRLADGDCSMGELKLVYKRIVARYTFNLESHTHPPCEPDGSAGIAENDLVRTYTSSGRVDGYPETVFYACRLDSGRTLKLGHDYCGDAYAACDYLDHLRLAGDKVAYVTGYDGDRYGRWRFTLNLLDTTTWIIETPFGDENNSPDGQEHAYRKVDDVELKDNGSIAWITTLWRRNYIEEPHFVQTYEVRKTDASGSNELLDSSPEIDPESLALNGSTLTWTRAGEPRSAQLD